MNAAMLVGFGFFALGFVVLFGLLASEGALNKSKQFGAFGRISSGKAGRGKRISFFLGLSSIILGAIVLFSGVAANDRRQRELLEQSCKKTCQERGYTDIELRNSTAKDPNNSKRPAFRACVCKGGPAPDPLEIDTQTLPQP